MDNPIKFRRSMQGYKKEDVNNYISRENIRITKLEESYKKNIKELEKELLEAKEKITDSEAKILLLREQEIEILDLRSTINDKDALIEEKDTIIEGLKSAVDSSNLKLSEAEASINELREKLLDTQNSVGSTLPYRRSIQEQELTMAEKAEKYDLLFEKVDEILAFAKEEADKIISEALEIRNSVSKRTVRDSFDPKKDITTKSNSIIDDLKRSIRRSIKNSLR